MNLLLYLAASFFWEIRMEQTQPNPIQVVEFPTYSFELKPSNVRCLESSFNERVISANQSVDDFFHEKL